MVVGITGDSASPSRVRRSQTYQNPRSEASLSLGHGHRMSQPADHNHVSSPPCPTTRFQGCSLDHSGWLPVAAEEARNGDCQRAPGDGSEGQDHSGTILCGHGP